MHSPQGITRLLVAWGDGDQSALEELAPLVQSELHWLAHHYMGGERPGHPLQTSAHVNEAYIRLINTKERMLAEPGPLLRRIGPADASHPG